MPHICINVVYIYTQNTYHAPRGVDQDEALAERADVGGHLFCRCDFFCGGGGWLLGLAISHAYAHARNTESERLFCVAPLVVWCGVV